jgi:hypothetical protein
LGNSGKNVVMWSSSEVLPCSARIKTDIAVNGFVTEASRKFVSAKQGVFLFRSARPQALTKIGFPFFVTSTLAPGTFPQNCSNNGPRDFSAWFMAVESTQQDGKMKSQFQAGCLYFANFLQRIFKRRQVYYVSSG